MRMYLLAADEDTLTGMRLAGIEGEIVSDAEGLLNAAQKAAGNSEIGILLVTATLGNSFPEQIVEIKKKYRLLVTQIPDMLNPSAHGDSITRYVREAIGIRVD